MTLRVITPPAAIVTPADILGGHAADDKSVARMIAAATRTIDGPDGWLGRCLAPQMLELSLDRWCGQNRGLPCGPVIKIESVRYLDAAGDEQIVDASHYRHFGNAIYFMHGVSRPALGSWPEPVRIRYEAGYNGAGEGKTGEIPPEAVQAIITLAQHLKATTPENLLLRSIEIPDVETRTFTVSDAADALIKRRVDDLLAGLRVYSL